MVAFFGGKNFPSSVFFVRYYSTNKKIHYFYHLQFQSLKTKSKNTKKSDIEIQVKYNKNKTGYLNYDFFQVFDLK